ncbi:MAG: hypothetical protein K0S28_1198, partial [Paucimonas sp.]|nr:hypothetical protein [Paucimonas sp.]
VLYWRGIVLGDYDGRTWAPFRLRRSSEAFNIKLLSGPIGYQVTLEPSGHRWLFALDLPVAAPDVDGKPSSFTPELELRSPQPVNSRTRYDASSALSYRLDAGDTPSDLGNWLSLPSGTNPGTNEFARHLRARHTEPEKAIDAVLHYFRNEPFRYTLEPPLLGVHSVDDFLFNTRAGFCEHYSGAFVVIMRAMGIPARVVTGYLGGELNAIDGFMEVRQSDAHAWAEVWLPQQGWLRVDPTAAVAPERIERNLYSAVPRRYLGGLVTTTGDNATLAWLLKVRSGWNAVGNAWNQWVLNYSSDKQKNLVRSLGLDASNWRDLILLLVACMALITVAIAYGLVRAREKVDPVVALYAKLCRRMEKHGLMRNRFEGPLSYRERLSRANALSGSQKEAAIRFLELYQAVQYGVSEPSRAAAAVRLKKLLSECR